MMFKIGDKVRRIKGNHAGMDIGDTDTVVGVGGGIVQLKEYECSTPIGGHDINNLELVKENQVNKPHKHAELIKAWADGKTIESRDYDGRWLIVSHPQWFGEHEYRIKPEPNPDVILHSYINNFSSNNDMLYDDVKLNNTAGVKDDKDNIRLTFDGETGKLKAVELLDTKG